MKFYSFCGVKASSSTHNPEVAGSNPVSATILSIHKGFAYEYSIFLLKKSFFVWSQTVWICDLFYFVMPLCFRAMLSVYS